MNSCPLCHQTDTQSYWQDKWRRYFQCQQCLLVFVHPEDRLTSAQEKSIYDLHQNHVDDLGYQKFLQRLSQPLLERLPFKSKGLDFGCGPGPALAKMLEQAGHQMSLYDLYYYPNKESLTQTYDFIVATEVIEHLYSPSQVWEQWLRLLSSQGYLGIMTKLVKNVDAFSTWHYKNDRTHVVFFSRETFEFLAKRDHLELEFFGSDVILLRKGQHVSQ